MHSSIRIRRPLVPYAALHRGSTRWAACLEPFLVYTLAFWLQCVTLRTACVRAIACNVSSRPPPRRSIVSYSNRPHLVRVQNASHVNEVNEIDRSVSRHSPVFQFIRAERTSESRERRARFYNKALRHLHRRPLSVGLTSLFAALLPSNIDSCTSLTHFCMHFVFHFR